MKKLTALLLLVAILATLALPTLAVDSPEKTYPQKFWDVPKDHWAFLYIAELADRGVINGHEDGSFKPGGTVSRAEFAKIMAGAAGIPVTDNNVYFKDMAADHWALPYVNAAKDYLTGYSDGYYRPAQAAVREDVTVAMVRLKGYNIAEADYSYLAKFTDVDSISNHVKAYVALAVEKGLITGFSDDTFRGQATLSRAEAAALLWRAFQYGSDNKLTDTGGVPAQTPETPPASPDTTTPPTDTPTQGETPDAPPYVIDTLVRADVRGYTIDSTGWQYRSNEAYFMTSDGNETIYYCANNSVYSVNTRTKATKVVIDLSSLDDTSSPFQSYEFYLEGICWDVYNNRLLLDGRDELYEVKDGVVTKRGDKMDYQHVNNPRLISTLSNGDYLYFVPSRYNINYNLDIVDPATFNPTASFRPDSVPNNTYYAALELGDSILIAVSDYSNMKFSALYTYDFVEMTPISIPIGTIRVGVATHGHVAASKDTVVLYPTGKDSTVIAPKDYEVADKTVIDFNSSSLNLFLMKDNSVVFYDTAADAFRILRESE